MRLILEILRKVKAFLCNQTLHRKCQVVINGPLWYSPEICSTGNAESYIRNTWSEAIIYIKHICKFELMLLLWCIFDRPNLSSFYFIFVNICGYWSVSIRVYVTHHINPVTSRNTRLSIVCSPSIVVIFNVASWYRNTFCVIVIFSGESTGYRCPPLQRPVIPTNLWGFSYFPSLSTSCWNKNNYIASEIEYIKVHAASP